MTCLWLKEMFINSNILTRRPETHSVLNAPSYCLYFPKIYGDNRAALRHHLQSDILFEVQISVNLSCL